MLRVLFLVSALFLSWAPPGARADESSAIRDVIAGQIEAFRADDVETAFGFASPMIKRMFGDPVRFGRMVREGYPMVWRPADVRFTKLSKDGGRKVQSVLMTDQNGALFIVDYEMIADGDGWQINGVSVRRTGTAGA